MTATHVDEEFTLAEAADYVALAQVTWRDYTLKPSRRRGPAPDRWNGPRDPRWYRSTLDEFNATRRRDGRPPGAQCQEKVRRGGPAAEPTACRRTLPCPDHSARKGKR